MHEEERERQEDRQRDRERRDAYLSAQRRREREEYEEALGPSCRLADALEYCRELYGETEEGWFQD